MNRAYLYHKNSLFKSEQGIAVFDPILFPDSKLHSLQELFEILETNDYLQIAVIRKT